MSRSLSGTAQYLSRASVGVAAAPMTMACWYRQSGNSTLRTLMLSGAASSRNQHQALVLPATGGTVQARSNTTTSTSATSTAGSTTTGVWYHAAAVFASATDRRAFWQGGNKGTGTSSRAPSNATHNWIGQCPDGTELYAGEIAWPAWWNVALDDAEIAALGAGVSPLAIRPWALVTFLPYLGTHSPEIDVMSASNFTVTGATASNEEPPRLWLPSRRVYVPVAGGSSYNASLTESLTASDAQASLGTLGATLTESVTGSDALATIATLARSLTESLTAADSQASSAGGTTYNDALTESLTRSDSPSSSATLPSSLTESLTRSDSLASLATLIGALTESLTGSDAQSSSAGPSTYDVTLTESLTRSDAQASTAALVATLVEARTAADALAALGVLGVSVVEAASLADLITAAGQLEPGARLIRVRFANRTVYLDTSGRVVGTDPAPRRIFPTLN